MLFSSLVSVIALVASVNAHGYVPFIKVNGKTFNGPIPGETNPKSPIRRISTIDPYKKPTGSGITCGEKSQFASIVAPATAGSKLTLSWVAHPGQKWPHEMGPVITWMAKVPAGQTADKFDAAQGEFFKVAQEGQEGKKWFVERFMKLNTEYSVTIPKQLEDGQYIMRHEIIALHLANQQGGAEFYTSCFQLNVTGGDGTATFAKSDLAKFPGAYTATDAGIYTPKVFDNGFKYKFPGPAIPSFASGGNSTEPSTEPSATVSASEPAEPTSTTTPDDDCTDEDPSTTDSAPEATPTESAPEPSTTDDCTDEDPEPTTASSSKAGKPTSNAHKNYRRAQAAARGWMSRMEKRSRK